MPQPLNKIALIIGATGGIGGEAAAALSRHGWTVRGLTRRSQRVNPAIAWTATKPFAGGATGQVAALLRGEGAIELTLAVLIYGHLGGSWPLFAALFLAPDLSMLGYLINPRIGAWLYNAGHTTIAPALLAFAGFMLSAPLLYEVAAIWAAHIGFDRLMGYGLKYPIGFGATHLNGKAQSLA